MATGGSSPGTIYSPLPQSISDADTTEDEEEEELNNIGLGRDGTGHTQKTPHIHNVKATIEGRNGRGRLGGRGAYQPLGGSDLTLNNGITSQLKSKDAESEVDVSHPPPLVLPSPERPSMSGPRKACFIFSTLLCFLVVIGFLFVLPCDLPGCIPPNDNVSNSSSSHPSSIFSLRSIGGSWERILPGIELKGRVHLVASASGPGINMVFLVRGQLPGLLSSSALPPPPMSLISSSFLSESSNCSFAPLLDKSNSSSMRNYKERANPPNYCNTHLDDLLSNYSITTKALIKSNLLERNSSQNVTNSTFQSHYRSKRILDNPPEQPRFNITQQHKVPFSEKDGQTIKPGSAAEYLENQNPVDTNRQQKQKVKKGLSEIDDHMKYKKGSNPKRKRSLLSKEKEANNEDEFVIGAIIGNGGGGLVSLTGTTGLPLWQLSLPSPPEELDCGLLDTDGDGIPDCLAFAGRSGLLAAVNPSTGAVIWYLHDHKSQMRPTALQFPVSLPDLDGDGTNEIAVACTLPNSTYAHQNNSSNKVSPTPPPNSSSYVHSLNSKGSPSNAKSSKKELMFSSSSSEFPPYQSSRPLPSPSSSPDTISLAVASGRSGSIIGQPYTPRGCVSISSITLNMQTLELFYRCIMEGGNELRQLLSVEDLYGEKFEGTAPPLSPSSSTLTSSPIPSVQMPSTLSAQNSTVASSPPLSSVLNAPSSTNPQRHSTSSSAWVSDHRLLVENHGHCHTILLPPPYNTQQSTPCSVSVRLTDSRNATLWAHEGVLAHAMDPVPLLFRQPSKGETLDESSKTFGGICLAKTGRELLFISQKKADLYLNQGVTESSLNGNEHPVSGFVLKFWQWSMPKTEHGLDIKEDKNRDLSNEKTPGGPNSLFRTRLKRSKDLILPPLAVAASSSLSNSSDNHSVQSKRQSPLGNLPRHGGLFPGTGPAKKKPKGSSYKGMSAPIVNQLKERVVLITFNDTGLHVINASQSDVTQLCERVKGGKKRGKGGGKGAKANPDLSEQKLRCQPELAFQEQSLLVADLDKDGYQELVSYLTTYVDYSRKDDDSDLRSRSSAPKWHLESRVKVVLLEAELPKLYEAVATPGS